MNKKNSNGTVVVLHISINIQNKCCEEIQVYQEAW